MTLDVPRQHDVFATMDSLSIQQLRGRRTAKWTSYGPDVLPAWVAEMDFPLASVIQDELVAAVSRSETGYPTEDPALPAAAAAWLARRFGMLVAPDQVKVLPDILKGIELGIKTFSPPGSTVVILTPAYPPFFVVPSVIGRETIQVPLTSRGERLTFDLDGIDTALRSGAGTVLLCNPHNPVGRVFTPAELQNLAEVVEKNGARVIADEVHAPLVYPGVQFTPYSTVSDAAARHSVTLTSASKGWNVAGLKCAQIVLTNRDDLEAWERLSFLETFGASILGILANRVAYTDGDQWLHDVVNYLDGNRLLLASLLQDHLPGVRYTIPEATYLAWLDCRSLDLDDPSAFFLDHARVALNPGSSFGTDGKGYVRLNFATSRAILTEIVQRMGRAVAKERYPERSGA